MRCGCCAVAVHCRQTQKTLAYSLYSLKCVLGSALQDLMHDMEAAAKSGKPFDFKSWIEGRGDMKGTREILGTGRHEAVCTVIEKLNIDIETKK